LPYPIDDTIAALRYYLDNLDHRSYLDEVAGRWQRDPHLFTQENTMFTDIIFKDHLVAVRVINSTSAEAMTVTVYEIDGHAGVPELLHTWARMQRQLLGGMPAQIRHSANWINKLDREYRSTY
jgi:methylphosphotriester-DNA--protein-cysteine methyltransferase